MTSTPFGLMHQSLTWLTFGTFFPSHTIHIHSAIGVGGGDEERRRDGISVSFGLLALMQAIRYRSLTDISLSLSIVSLSPTRTFQHLHYLPVLMECLCQLPPVPSAPRFLHTGSEQMPFSLLSCDNPLTRQPSHKQHADTPVAMAMTGTGMGQRSCCTRHMWGRLQWTCAVPGTAWG